MSATHVDCSTLHEEWDGSEEVRARVRKGDGLLSEEGGKDMKIPRCVANSELLIPILLQIGAGCRLAEIEGLREAVKKTYDLNQRSVTEADIDEAAWGIRDMIFFVKRKTQREEVSKAAWWRFFSVQGLRPRFHVCATDTP